jgi:hypothetical protein
VAATDRSTFLFIHVMKTGGTTFVQHIESNFAADELFPAVVRGEARRRQYYMIDELRALSPERRRTIRAYVGHFPYTVRDIVGSDAVTLTILREPVARTISVLRHCRRYDERHHDRPLEEIYEDPWVFPMYIHDYQTKLFAMGPGDRLESHLDVIEIDDDRLARAQRNLEEVDILGLTDEYDRFVGEMRRRFGWRCPPVPNLRVSTEDWDVEPSFRRRIAADNAADVAFSEHATQLHRRRRHL